jgi:hypothetical protein
MLTRKTTETETEYSPRSNGNSRTSTPTSGQQPTHEQIARRAYEISKSGTGGTPEANWYRAERELRARA